MKYKGLTDVEVSFMKRSGRTEHSTKVPYIVVQNFPNLGLLTSLRFLEWVSENPEGLISLPTGKTPEYFVKWTMKFLNGWDKPETGRIMADNGFSITKKPVLRKLRFVQMDEFYPINPRQHNSFYDYIQNFYIKGFGIDPSGCFADECRKDYPVMMVCIIPKSFLITGLILLSVTGRR